MPSWIRIRPPRLILSLISRPTTLGLPDLRVYVTLQNSGEFELPLGYATINGDLFNLPARADLICDRR